MSRRARDGIPLLLTALRAALGPVVVAMSLVAPSRLAFGACLVIAFLSDVFDGIIARRLGIATPALRRLDSIADTVFYVGATFAVWQLFPSANEVEFLDLGEYQNAEIHCTPFLPANETLTWASLVDSIAALTMLMFTSGDALTSTSRSAPATFRAERAAVRSAGETGVLFSTNSPFARICRAAWATGGGTWQALKMTALGPSSKLAIKRSVDI